MSTSTESPVLAGPPGDCCVQGVKHTGVPVGRVETIAGVETYVSDAPAKTAGPTKVILFFADVYGPLFENAKLLQDYFASHGKGSGPQLDILIRYSTIRFPRSGARLLLWRPNLLAHRRPQF